VSNKNIINIINKYFNPPSEYRAAYELWLRNITSEDVSKENIPDDIKKKVIDELIELEKRP